MSSWYAALYFKELQQRCKKGVWMCLSGLTSLSQSSGAGREDCFLFVCLLSCYQSPCTPLHPDLGDISDVGAPCKRRREQLKGLHLDEYVFVQSLTRGGLFSLFHYAHDYKVHGVISLRPMLYSLYSTHNT